MGSLVVVVISSLQRHPIPTPILRYELDNTNACDVMASFQTDNQVKCPETSGVVLKSANCVLCGSTEGRIVLTASNFLYDRPGQARIVRCEGCGHFYQSPRPTRETIGLCYPKNYGPHLESSHAEATEPANDVAHRKPWYLSSIVRSIPGLRSLYHGLRDRFSDIAPPAMRPGRALEIGCGNGTYLTTLQQQGWDIEGIEPALEPSERCRARGLRVRTGVFEDFDLESESYDAVIAWMVVEHLHDPVSALRAIHRILRPDGLIVFSVPNVACWETWFFRRYHYIYNEPTHLHHFTPRSIRKLLALAGFELNRLHYQENLYYVVGSLGIWLSSCFPKLGGQRLLDFCESPSMRGRLALAPFAKLAAALRQTGRITIVATPKTMPNNDESAFGRKES
jgi:SAM-dependent methyltransferase